MTSSSSRGSRPGSRCRREERRPSGVRLVRIPRTATRWPAGATSSSGPAIRGGHAGPSPAGCSGICGPGRPAGSVQAPRLLATLVALPWIAYRLVAYGLLGDRAPGLRRRGQLDYVMTWRRSVFPWAHAAAGVAPDADVHHGHDVEGLAAAVAAADRDGLRSSSTTATSCTRNRRRHARQGTLARLWLRSLERRLARHAVALVTVNRRSRRSSAGSWASRARWSCTTRRRAGRRPIRPRTCSASGWACRPRRGSPCTTAASSRTGAWSSSRKRSSNRASRPCMPCSWAMARSARCWIELAADPRFGGRLHVVDAVPPTSFCPGSHLPTSAVMPIQPVHAQPPVVDPEQAVRGTRRRACRSS